MEESKVIRSATRPSFHIEALAHAGLISQARQWRNRICRASFDQMSSLLAYLSEYCCQGQSRVVNQAAPAPRAGAASK